MPAQPLSRGVRKMLVLALVSQQNPSNCTSEKIAFQMQSQVCALTKIAETLILSQSNQSNQSRARGGPLGYFLGGYVPPGTPNWQPRSKKNFP